LISETEIIDNARHPLAVDSPVPQRYCLWTRRGATLSHLADSPGHCNPSQVGSLPEVAKIRCQLSAHRTRSWKISFQTSLGACNGSLRCYVNPTRNPTKIPQVPEGKITWRYLGPHASSGSNPVQKHMCPAVTPLLPHNHCG